MDAGTTEPDFWLRAFQALVGAFGPGGAVLAIANGAQAWWLKRIHKEHREERDALVAQIKDSEKKRREDGIAQFSKIDGYIDKVAGALEKTSATITELRISIASRGVNINAR